MKEKQIEMTISEFINFRRLALMEHVKFLCSITAACTYIVIADGNFLTKLGF